MAETPIHSGLKALSKAVRPQILKLAERRKLIDMCFKEFQRSVYPGAPQDQVAELRVAFMAGAAELYSVLVFGSDMGTDDVTDADMNLFAGVVQEIEDFHRRTIDATKAQGTVQ